MIRALKSSFFFVLYLGLSACSSPTTATIPPSPQPVHVSFSPALEPVRDALYACAISLPEIALFVEIIPEPAQDFKSSDLVLWWGDKPDEVDFAFPIAEDELVLIVHTDNLNTELSLSELRALFSGRVEHWSEISIYDQPVSVWVSPENSHLSEIFKSAILDDLRYTRLAYLAPSPAPMLESIAADPGGIGFIPLSWLSSEVSTIQIDPDSQLRLRKPILALVNSEPQAGLRELIACLQSGEGQVYLLDKLSPSD